MCHLLMPVVYSPRTAASGHTWISWRRVLPGSAIVSLAPSACPILGARASCSPPLAVPGQAIVSLRLAALGDGSVVPGAGAPVRAGYPLVGVSRSQDAGAPRRG